MPQWLSEIFARSSSFMPHGHCYLWIPSLLWLHVLSDLLIGLAYVGISLLLYLFVRKIRLAFSPVFIAFGLFIGLCGLTHFMSVWTVWNPDYFVDGVLKAATAAASVATAIGLLFIRPQIEAVVHTARLSEERRVELEGKNAELEGLYARVKDLDQLKTQFFANVSHELRTPIALILAPLERLADAENLRPEQKEHLDGIRRNAKTLLKHVNDLLDVAKLEAGKMRIDYSRFDAAGWTRRIASQFEFVAQARNVALQINTPAQLQAEADPELLERILLNLLSNAFKFTPQGGSVRLDLSSNDTHLSLAVSDSGPGIGAEQQELIFDRFRQADSSASRGYGGTGLGLAIAKELVSLHGGHIEVASTPGMGAVFTVQVPLRAPAAAAVREDARVRSPEVGIAIDAMVQDLSRVSASERLDVVRHSAAVPRVLVVEDNPDMSLFITSTLADEYNVLSARDGEEGFERALSEEPDLIISDVMMPKMSGDELVARLRATDRLDAVPILLLTARSDDALRVRLLASGAQDFLSKPFLAEELLARARNLIAMKRTGDALRETLASASNDLVGLAADLALKHRQLETAFENVRVAKEHAEEASKVKSYFLGMISHELRTPLSNISMNVRLLSRAEASMPPPAPEALARLQRATAQMSTLIEGLLEYARAESGRVKAEPAPVDPVAVAQDVVRMHGEQLAKQVKLSLRQPSSPLPEFMTDPRLFRVILDNLVSNALKFTQEGEVSLGIAASDGGLIVEVQDSGIGIDHADIPRIFLPFEQLEPVHRKSIPGVGLGLALVKQFAETLGGTIEVESQPGRGSLFRVRLPTAHQTVVEVR